MGYGNRIIVDIYNIGRKTKIGCLYDSEYEQEGAAHNIKRHVEMNGWKELSFDLPVNVNGEHNWRADLMTNEYELRVSDGNDVDWYRLTEPSDTTDGVQAEHSVTCPHASVILKKRNIYLEFNDENGIGTLAELAAKALDGTGWSLGLVDTFYEPDGVTEKVRTYTCNEKTGAYKMIQDMCQKFVAYPVFHGDTQTVDLLARANHVGMLEMRLDKNLTKLTRKRDSGDLITRLYVEGEYGDLGYVGIDTVNPATGLPYNPTGLPFLLNFDYYRSISALSPEQETAITTYITQTASTRATIRTLAAQNEADITQLYIDWGAQPYLIYPVSNGAYDDPIYGSGATTDDDAAVGDTVASVKADGSYTYRELSALTPAANEKWMVKFVTPVAGTLGGKEVAIEAKQQTIATLQAEIAKPGTTETMKAALQAQIDATNADIATLQSEAAVLMLACINRALAIDTATAQLATLNEQLLTIEATFSDIMGDMLQDGYFSDESYAPGQEEALYNDSVELLNTLAYPQVSYNFSEIDLANVEGYTDEIFTLDMAVHLLDETQDINDYGFVSQVDESLDLPNSRSCTVQTDELNIQSKSFASFMGRVTDAAQVLKDEQSVFERARAISKEGTFGADKLNGIIDVLQNKLMSSVSNWYTDENGNLMFISADETSAMMLSGSGFMVADGKNANGDWNWRTFGTGKGFTADVITAGVLRAGLITILGSDQFYWTSDNIYVIDPTDDLKQIRIGRYDGANLGIGYTADGGVTWQTAIGFDGVHLSATDSLTLQTLETQMALVPGQISAAVNDLQIGGTNMIRMADGYVTILRGASEAGDVWQDSQEHYYDLSQMLVRVGPGEYGTTLATMGLVRFASAMPQIPNTKYTLSFWAWTEPEFPVISGNPDGNPRIAIQQLVNGTNTIIQPTPHDVSSVNNLAVIYPRRSAPEKFEFTFYFAAYPDTITTADLRFNVTSAWTGAGKYIYIGDVKVEAGNKATAWSPHPEELRSGAGFIINPNQLLFYGPVIDMEINGSDQAFHLDETGGVMGDITVINKITAPNMAEKYDGGATVTIGAGEDFETFKAFCTAVNNKTITVPTLTVHITSDLNEGALTLGGVSGITEIQITGWPYNPADPTPKTITGNLSLRYNNCPIEMTNINFDGQTNVYGGFTRCTDCQFNGSGWTGNNTTAALYLTHGAKVFLHKCAFYNADRFIWALHTADISCVDLKGGIKNGSAYRIDNTYLYLDGGTARLSGTRPIGEFHSSGNAYIMSPAAPDALTTDPSTGSTPDVPDVPTEPTTTTLTSTMSGTYFSVRQAWDAYEPNTSGNFSAIRQGVLNWNGKQQLYGTFWFSGLSGIPSGAHVVSASLTLTRMYSGVASPVDVKVYTTPVESKIGDPTTGKSNGFVLGTISNMNPTTETYDLPITFAQTLVDHPAYGIVLDVGDTQLLSGMGYSRNYCRFDSDTLKPVLTITYK